MPSSIDRRFAAIGRRSTCADSQQPTTARRPIPGGREHRGLRSACYVLLLAVIGLSLVAPTDATSKNESSTANSAGCAHMRSLVNGLSRSRSQRRIDERTVPTRPIAGDHLKVCTQSLTCCTEEMELRLKNESGEDVQRRIQDKIIGLRHTFESRSSRFDRFFRELLTNARKELHSMFLQTYGGFYERHADVFSGLFDNLTDYYTTGRTDVSDSLDGFYQTLYRRMFAIMNPLMPVTDEKWECMRPTMDELHPFGDVPRKMTQQVQRSMVAARVFVQALATARDVVHRVMELNLSAACSTGLMRMSYCGLCAGEADVRPCNNLCLNVMKGCLARQAELDADWNAFVDALLNLLDRLKGPYNLENVINPLNVQISEAIMIFQEKGQNISTKVMENCFDLAPNPSSRVKRRAVRPHNSHELSLDELQYGTNRVGSAASAPASSLERMAQELREKVAIVKGFWRSLSYSVCNDRSVAAPADEENNCWNGLKKDKYTVTLVGDGLANQANNPEVPVSESAGMVTDQILRLRMDTSRLQRAYEGRTIDWEATASDQNRPRAVLPAAPIGDDDDEAEMSGSGDGEDKNELKISDFPRRQSPKTKGVPKVVADNSDDEELVVEEGSGSGDFVEPPPVVSAKGTHRDNGLSNVPVDPPEPPTVPRTMPPKFELPEVGNDFKDTTDDFEIAVASERPPTKSSSHVCSSVFLLLVVLLTATVRIR